MRMSKGVRPYYDGMAARRYARERSVVIQESLKIMNGMRPEMLLRERSISKESGKIMNGMRSLDCSLRRLRSRLESKASMYLRAVKPEQ